MKVNAELEDVSSVKKRLKVEIPAEEALQEFNSLASEYKKHARLPGFRPGKAPVNLVKRRFQKDLRDDLLQKLIPQSYDQAIQEKGVQPVGRPNLANINFQEGQPVTYEALFEVRPEIPLSEYKGLRVSLPEEEDSQEGVEQELERLREKYSRLESVEDRTVRDGDYVVIDLQGEYLDSSETPEKPDEPISEEDVTVKVGDERTHESFSSALLGMNLAEEKTFEVEYAPNYPEQKLAGRKVRFSVEVTDIKERHLPELDDEFAREVGEYDDLDDLRSKLAQQLERVREENRRNKLRAALVDRLLQGAEFEVPDTWVEDRTDDKIRELAINMKRQGVDPSRANVDWARVRSELKQEAEKDVRARLVLREVAAREGLEVSSDELDDEIAKLADSLNQPVEKVRQYVSREGGPDVKDQILRRKALDLVEESSTVTAGK